MKNYLITGVSLRSKGGSAMVQAACRLIGVERRYSILSFYPQMDRDALRNSGLKIDIQPCRLLSRRGLAFKLEIFLMTLDYFVSVRLPRRPLRLSSYARVLRDMDGVLEIHGIAFSDHYGFNDAFTSFLKMKLARRFGVPFFCLPQSYGPTTSRLNLFLAKQALESTRLALPRGMISVKFLQRLRLKTPRVEFMPDLAFAFENPSRELIDAIAARYKPQTGTRYVAIIPNILFLRWGRPETVDYYVELMRRLQADYGFEFILIPHQYNDRGTDDRDFNNAIAARFGAELLMKIDGLLTANEIKALLSFCDITICSRFHGMVSSLKMGVEPFVIGWADKYQEIMDLYELGDNVCDYRSFDVERMYSRIRQRLGQPTDAIRARTEELATMLESLSAKLESGNE
ncbi:MAG: polysaccharide pyruvyl transferase family protein [Candidatus Cloacimonetes bacterium]|nr:polysaccharide pyruvyl transferase family protein [Candidatus Cloacimonadota bacterium]